MNSRERVLAALDHKEPDMVPIDLGGTENTTIARLAYINLRSYLGMPAEPDPFVINRQMDAVFPQEDLLQRFQVDFRPVKPSPTWLPEVREMPDDSFYDELSIRWKKAAYYYDMVEHPFAQFTYEDVDRFNWPDPYAPERLAGVSQQAKALYTNSQAAIVLADIVWGPFELGCALRGYEQFLTDLLQNQRFASHLLECNLEFAIRFWDAYLSEVGEHIHIVGLGDDLGIQTGPMISPALYRKFIKPLHRQLIEFIRTKTKARIFMHSCGSIYDLIPELIEVGVEILSPVQFTAAKMDLGKLKQEFGQQLTFWGAGINTQGVLPFGSLQEIRDEVSRNIDLLAPGGGFVFVPVHNIQADISPERILTLYETALEKRKY